MSVGGTRRATVGGLGGGLLVAPFGALYEDLLHASAREPTSCYTLRSDSLAHRARLQYGLRWTMTAAVSLIPGPNFNALPSDWLVVRVCALMTPRA